MAFRGVFLFFLFALFLFVVLVFCSSPVWVICFQFIGHTVRSFFFFGTHVGPKKTRHNWQHNHSASSVAQCTLEQRTITVATTVVLYALSPPYHCMYCSPSCPELNTMPPFFTCSLCPAQTRRVSFVRGGSGGGVETAVADGASVGAQRAQEPGDVSGYYESKKYYYRIGCGDGKHSPLRSRRSSCTHGNGGVVASEGPLRSARSPVAGGEYKK